jgi:bifunctional non-homologous end joining protein LigD
MKNVTATKDEIRAGRRTVKISNRDKVLFPEDGITKGDLVEYYVAIAPRMVPLVKDRPLTMERYPDGISSERIFQKNISKYFPDWIPRAEVPKKGGSVTHVLANDTATLAYLANQASITQHVWLSTVKVPTKPDQIIFDLDPSQEDFAEVRRTALRLREMLEEFGLVPFVKTTGSRGLHVVVPIRPVLGFEVVYGIAAAVAARIAEERPTKLTTEFMKAKREGRIFLDINRNAYAQTAVAPYSVRPLRGAPVAAPVTWEEVADRRLRPDGFSMKKALERPDQWTGFRRAARSPIPVARSLGIAANP